MPIATDPLSRTFFALADPTRRAMLDRLAQGTATVGELAQPFSMSRPAISQHLGMLADAGLIERTRTGQWRTCSLRPEGMSDAQAWVAEHRALWQTRFDRLDDVLRDVTRASAKANRPKQPKTSKPSAPRKKESS